MGVGDEFYIGINSNEDYEVSTNSSCITVKNSGYVKAIKPGKAVVTVKTPSVTKTCTITVKAGNNRIKIVGDKGSSVEFDLSIAEGDFTSH